MKKRKVNNTALDIVSLLIDHTQALANLSNEALEEDDLQAYHEYMYAAKVVFQIAQEIHESLIVDDVSI